MEKSKWSVIKLTGLYGMVQNDKKVNKHDVELFINNSSKELLEYVEKYRIIGVV